MEGPPITAQFYSEQLPAINACLFVNEANVTQVSLRHLAKYCKHGEFVIYGHNLKFDLLSLFYPRYRELVKKSDGTFTFSYDKWHIEGIYGTPTFCRMRKGDACITIVDSFGWFRSSLDKAARLVCPGLPKLPRPKNLGSKLFDEDDMEFIEYAMRDAEVAYHIGVAIDEMHHEFDLRQSISVANMAANIFQQHYIDESAPIYNTGPRILVGARMSYHGGKNNLYPGSAPAWHSHVDAWDLSSAYPHAMTQLPAFSKAKLFVAGRIFSPKVKQVPDFGVYQISGSMAECHWPSLFESTQRAMQPLRDKFVNQWVTGFELNEALRSDEVKLTKVGGHIYDVDKDPVTETAMQRYVKDFYRLKSEASDPVHRFLYKVLMNSLYGKFIQQRDVEDEDGSIRRKPGPLYHPFAASLITGHTRAVMHKLEHYTQAIHTATDGVFCGADNSPKDGQFPFAPADGIGAIESEGNDMELCLLRNKCYLLYTDKPGNGFKSFVRPNRYVAKYATHGFQGGPKVLEELVMHNKRKYTVEKPNTLRISVRQGRVPNKFEKRDLMLKVAPIKGHFNHKRGKTNGKDSQKDSP
jgi:hypothetical protein